MKKHVRALSTLMAMLMALSLLCACSSANSVKLDPKNPITITVWHYYNGAILNAFEAAVREFNETVGLEKGIIVEIYGQGSINELEKAVMASANQEIGSQPMPSIFASYADTAYQAEKLELLADLEKYFSKKEQEEYLPSYIEEGRIGQHGELRIFPVAKSTEMMMVNETDWAPFAADCGLNFDDLSTMEGIARVSKLYYEWSGGKSFFGRDGMANLFIIASMQYGTQIFNVTNGTAKIEINETAMRKIWDYYYVPYISGYYSSYGKFRSDDARVGDILAYVGSTASAAYFPTEVTAGGVSYPITAKVLPAPTFEGAQRVLVQQGAGMVVLKSTPQEEYASITFLKWFTQPGTNIAFSLPSGYMPVKKEAIDYELIKAEAAKAGIETGPINDETMRLSIEQIGISELYTNKAFNGGTQARSILETDLQTKAETDRATVIRLMEGGSSLDEAVAALNTDANYEKWLSDLTSALNEAAG